MFNQFSFQLQNCVNSSTTQDNLETFFLASFIANGIGQIIIASLGLLVNGLCVYVLLKSKELTCLFNTLLAILLITDNVYLAFNVFETVHTRLGITSELNARLKPWLTYPGCEIFKTTVIYLMVTVGGHHYFAIKYNKDAYTTNNPENKKAGLMYLGSFVAAFIVNFPAFFEFHYDFELPQEYRLQGTKLRSDHNYRYFYSHWFQFMVIRLIPCTLLCWTAYQSYRNLMNQSEVRKRETKIVLFLCIQLLLLSIPISIERCLQAIYVEEEQYCWYEQKTIFFPIWMYYWLIFTRISPVLNSSIKPLVLAKLNPKLWELLRGLFVKSQFSHHEMLNSGSVQSLDCDLPGNQVDNISTNISTNEYNEVII